MNFNPDDNYINLINQSIGKIMSRNALGDELTEPVDKRNCEIIFVRMFMTEEMQYDFPLIARDFLKHEYANLEKYKDLSYEEGKPESGPFDMNWKKLILHTIYIGYKEGSEYCRELLKYLFKTYHSKLYGSFKRFREFDMKDIMSIATVPQASEFECYFWISVVLCMAEVFGKKMSKGCELWYFLMDDLNRDEFYRETWPFQPVDFLEFEDGLFQQCVQEVKDMFNDDPKKAYRAKHRSEKYTYKTLQYFGYSKLTVIANKEPGFEDLLGELARVLAIYKKTYPNKECTKDDLLKYAAQYDAINALTNTADNLYWDMVDVLGLSDDEAYEESEIFFNPDKIKLIENSQSENKAKNAKEIPAKSALEKEYKQEDLLQTIESLRTKVRIAEKDVKDTHQKLNEANRRNKELSALKAELESNRQELAALRSHVYHSTEYDIPADEDSYDDMIKVLSDKKITIIGGHSNWTQKLKELFPGWKYVTPNVSVSNDASWVNNSEYVYFFTDTISHSVYGKFIQLVREKGIPFGYISGVNIKANVKQLYEDISHS